MDSPNRLAIELVDEAIDFADEFGITVRHLANDAVVLDFGSEAADGLESGLLTAEIATAGLATIQTRVDSIAGRPRTHVELATDHPGLALLGCQHAAWELSTPEFAGLASGPARLLTDRDEFDLGFTDDFDLTALIVESPTRPDEAVAEQVAKVTDVPTSGVYVLSVPTASLAGSVSGAARAAEVAVLRLARRNYDPANIIAATSRAPIAPVAGDHQTALGRVNDAIAYGASVHLVVDEPIPAIDDLPFSATAAAGRSFGEVLAEAEWDFGAVADAFAPATITVDVRGGPTQTVGRVDEEALADRLEL